MKQLLLHLLCTSIILSLSAANLEQDIQQAIKHYHISESSDAIPGFQKFVQSNNNFKANNNNNEIIQQQYFVKKYIKVNNYSHF